MTYVYALMREHERQVLMHEYQAMNPRERKLIDSGISKPCNYADDYEMSFVPSLLKQYYLFEKKLKSLEFEHIKLEDLLPDESIVEPFQFTSNEEKAMPTFFGLCKLKYSFLHSAKDDFSPDKQKEQNYKKKSPYRSYREFARFLSEQMEHDSDLEREYDSFLKKDNNSEFTDDFLHYWLLAENEYEYLFRNTNLLPLVIAENLSRFLVLENLTNEFNHYVKADGIVPHLLIEEVSSFEQSTPYYHQLHHTYMAHN